MAANLDPGPLSPREALLADRRAGAADRLPFYEVVSVTAEDGSGRTMLSHAAEALDAEAVAVLLRRGADPNAVDRSELTPLLRVAAGPRDWPDDPASLDETVTVLLQGGASMIPRDSSGRNAAQRAAANLVHPFFRALEKAVVKPSGREEGTGDTLLHLVARAVEAFRNLPGEEAVERETDALMIAKILVERFGFDREARNSLGRTARDLAVKAGSRLLAPWLAHGDEVLGKTERCSLLLLTGGATAQEAAAMRDETKTAALIRLGLAPDEPAAEGDQQGLTPLSAAAEAMAVGAMELLLDAGADPAARLNQKAPGGRMTEGTSAMRMLIWAPGSPTRLPSGLTLQDWRRALTMMLRAPALQERGGARFVADAPADPEGRTPLLILAQQLGRGWRAGGADWATSAAGVLLTNGADPNRAMPPAGDPSPFAQITGGATPLHLALRAEGPAAEDFVQILLDAGADPNLADVKGVTPLMTAAGHGNPASAEAMTERLLEAGADPTASDAEGRTALDRAAAEGHARVVGKLLDAVSAWREMHPKPEDAGAAEAASSGNDAPAGPQDDCGPAPAPEPAAPEEDAEAPSGSSFFARIRARAPQAAPEPATGGAPVAPQSNATKAAKEAGEPVEANEEPAVPEVHPARAGSGSSFFARIRARAPQAPSTRPEDPSELEAEAVLQPEKGDAPGAPEACAASSAPETSTALTPEARTERIRTTFFFLKLLAPEEKPLHEVELLARGLVDAAFSPGDWVNPFTKDRAYADLEPAARFPRMVADLLIGWGVAVEVDWKTEAEDFCAAVASLPAAALFRERGFEAIPLPSDDDEVPVYARHFDAVCEALGIPLRIAALDVDSDGFVLALLPARTVPAARGAAAAAGLRLSDSANMH